MGVAQDDEEGDFAGGMTERNIDTARKLIPNSENKPQMQDDDDCEIEPAINHDPETDAKPITVGKLNDEKAAPNEVQINDIEDDDDDDDDSDLSKSNVSARYQKPKDAREIITAAIAATNQPIKITWENITFSATVSKPAGCCKTQKTKLQILKGCTGSAMPG